MSLPARCTRRDGRVRLQAECRLQAARCTSTPTSPDTAPTSTAFLSLSHCPPRERLLGLRLCPVRIRLWRKWAVAPSPRMKDVQHADEGSGRDDRDRCQIESEAD